MYNKKLFIFPSLIFFILISFILMVSYNSKNHLHGQNYHYQDGQYYITFTHLDNLGWAPFMTMTIDNGKIISVNMDCVDDIGMLKSENEFYKEAMKDNTGTTPKESFSSLEEQLIETQNINYVDAVSGATHTSHWFKEMATYILAHPDENQVLLEMNESYTASMPSYNSHGWKGFISIEYKDNKIINVMYDEYNKEGISKKDDADYKSAMTEVCQTYPAQYTKALENQILLKQSADVDVISGATQSSQYFISLAKEASDKRKINPLTVLDE